MLTVGQALSLPVFEGAVCVAGKQGLDHIVAWVHNMGVPDAARWLNGGELVLTTYINLPADAEEQLNYLRALIDRDVSALALAVGRYIDHIPDSLRALADAHDFPLIEIPYQRLFVNIARDINMLISQRELRQALSVQQALTQVVLAEGGLSDLASTLAKLLNQSVSIEDERFQAFASFNVAPVDEARRYTQLQGRTDPRLVQALAEGGYLEALQTTRRSIRLPVMPEVGLEMERILAPIVVHGDIYGYVWIIADGRPFSELDQMAVEIGATIAALMLLREEKSQRDEASERDDLILRLLGPRAAEREDALIDRAARYGLNLRAPYRLIVFDGIKPPLSHVLGSLNRLLANRRVSAVIGQYGEQVIVLTVEDAADDIARGLLHGINGDQTHLRAAVSLPLRGVGSAWGGLTDCQDSLAVATRLSWAERMVRCESLGFLLALYRAGAEALRAAAFVNALRAMREENTADLFHTLDIYLDQGGSSVQTAEILHIHRSTLNYRLGRIGDHLKADLSDPLVRVNLHTSVKLMRLFDAPRQPK
jgi:purine catabolism regulator